jgi:predicted O-methyltransferase YrrM
MKLKLEIREVLSELEALDAIDTNDDTPRERRVRCITPLTGELLHMLILMARPQRILELGTSAGYSTIWMASAAERIGASVITIDSDRDKISWACSNIERAGLRDVVDVFHEEAVDFINKTGGPFDLVFMDHGASFYVDTFDALRSKLRIGGCILVDGWKSVERWDTVPALVSYKNRVLKDSAFESFLLPLEKGTMISTRINSSPWQG